MVLWGSVEGSVSGKSEKSESVDGRTFGVVVEGVERSRMIGILGMKEVTAGLGGCVPGLSVTAVQGRKADVTSRRRCL